MCISPSRVSCLWFVSIWPQVSWDEMSFNRRQMEVRFGCEKVLVTRLYMDGLQWSEWRGFSTLVFVSYRWLCDAFTWVCSRGVGVWWYNGTSVRHYNQKVILEESWWLSFILWLSLWRNWACRSWWRPNRQIWGIEVVLVISSTSETFRTFQYF